MKTVKQQHKTAIALVVVLLVALMAACQPATAPEATIPPTPVQEASPTPAQEASPTPVQEASPTPVQEASPTPAQEVSPTPAQAGGGEEDIVAVSRRIVESIEAPAPAPPGWQVTPCEGMAPMFCVESDELVGAMELGLFPMESMTDFQATLATHGLSIETMNTESEAYASAAEPLLREFVAAHRAVLEEDRQITFGDRFRFEPLEIQMVQFGQLPGIQHGFMLVDADGQVMERVISFAAFDANYVYVLNAVYDPAAMPNFSSDEALQTLAPYLPQILARLQLPG
jgi:hypothetical protein